MAGTRTTARRCWRGSRLRSAPIGAASPPRQPRDAVFTVGNYPVEARADNAVAAKTKALADGQQAAFHSLLKRLVPVTAYQRLRQLRQVKAGDLVEGVSVRSERNSSTDYIASLDFSFQSKGVRDLLRREGIPFTDEQAPTLTAGSRSGARPASRRAEGRGGLDQRVERPRSGACADAGEAAGPEEGGRARTPSTRSPTATAAPSARLSRPTAASCVLLAVAEQDVAARRLNVTLTGRDAVGAFMLQAGLPPRPRRSGLRQRAGGRGLARHPRGPLEGHQVSRWRRQRRRWALPRHRRRRQRPADRRASSAA